MGLVSVAITPSAGKTVWASGFLPSVYQGVPCRSQGDPVLYVSNPPGLDARADGHADEPFQLRHRVLVADEHPARGEPGGIGPNERLKIERHGHAF